MHTKILNYKYICLTTVILIILVMFRFHITAEINSNLKELQHQDSHEAKYQLINDEIAALKNLIKDDLHYLYNVCGPSIREELSNSTKVISDALHDLEKKTEQLTLELDKSDQDPKSSDNNKGSSPPFKKYHSYRLLWFATVRNNYGGSESPANMGSAGFAAEALDFIIPLCKKYPLFGWVEEVDIPEWKQSFLFQSLPIYEQNLVEECNRRGSDLLEMDNIPGIGVMEYMPNHFEKIRTKFSPHTDKLRYMIGRSMFETNNVPAGWKEQINKHVNEMWVPTKFHVDVFSSNGVTVPVHNIGEGYDPVRFNSTNIQENRAGLYPSCNSDDYIFLCASDYINRKGFALVFEAYASAFTSEDKVCLAVRASGLTEFTFSNPNNLRRHNVGRLSSDEYSQFYKSGNVFVSGSHGEGWGRTNQEAMAMGLPVILPVWGGTTGYTREDVVITIKVDGLEQAFPAEGDYGHGMLGDENERKNHKWAEVQVPRIRDAMKWAYNNQEKAQEIGHRAQEYMRKYFTRSVIADDVLDRTDAIFNKFSS